MSSCHGSISAGLAPAPAAPALHLLQALLAENDKKRATLSERLAHEKAKRVEFDEALKAVEAEYGAAQKQLEATNKKVENAAAAMKELEQKDVKVRPDGGVNCVNMSCSDVALS